MSAIALANAVQCSCGAFNHAPIPDACRFCGECLMDGKIGDLVRAMQRLPGACKSSSLGIDEEAYGLLLRHGGRKFDGKDLLGVELSICSVTVCAYVNKEVRS